MFYLIRTVLLIICLPNVSYSITNTQQFQPSPTQLLSANQQFLLLVNSPQFRPRERFRENARENARENLRNNLRESLTREKNIENYESFKIPETKVEGVEELKVTESKQPESNNNGHHGGGGHHRDQRRVRFEKNLYDSNRTMTPDNQQQWLPEQTIWRPYYMPRRLNPPPFHRHGMVPPQFQGNLMSQQQGMMQRMPPPYELFPPTQSINGPQPVNLNSRLPNNNAPPPPNGFNPVLVDNNGVFNVELVNERYLNPADQQQFNFDNVHIIENNNQAPPNNNELEKEQPSLEKKINDKLKLSPGANNNSSEIQLINSINSNDGQFNKPNSPLLDLDSNAQFNDPNFNRANNKLGPADPQLFINRIKQTVVTNESFIMQNPNSKPRLEEKANIGSSNLNETTKILDTSPQQYAPVHFRQTFEQIQAQQKENQQRFNSQFTPLLYPPNNQPMIVRNNNNQQQQQTPTTKSSLDVVSQLMNPMTNAPVLSNQHLANPMMNSLPQTSPSPMQQPPMINPYSSPNLLKRLQQQQLQNALLARLGSHNANMNSIEAARRMNSLVQERATRERASNLASVNNLSSSPSSINSNPSMDASKSNAKEFFTRRTNTHRYVIVTILMTAIIVISIGITVIYVKQRRLNLHNTQRAGDLSPSEIASSYGRIQRMFTPRASSNIASDSDSYGASYISNRSGSTSVETGSTSGPKAVRSNVIMHR